MINNIVTSKLIDFFGANMIWDIQLLIFLVIITEKIPKKYFKNDILE